MSCLAFAIARGVSPSRLGGAPSPWRRLVCRTDRRFQLTPALPHAGHRLPQFFVRDVQVPLRLLDVGMAEHQLNRADVHVLRQEATRALMTQVVPVQINLVELGAIDARTRLRTLRLVAELPGSLEATDVRTRRFRFRTRTRSVRVSRADSGRRRGGCSDRTECAGSPYLSLSDQEYRSCECPNRLACSR